MKYSVIIPAYNAEKTLDRCLRSIVMQEYQDAEIILINDGSCDRTDEICRYYAAEDNRIIYIAKENGGVSSARNTGLDVARGEYILFVDSDDFVEPNYFTSLDQIAPDWDYVLFSYYIANGIQKNVHTLNPFQTYDAQEFASQLGQLIYRKRMNCPWNKRYKRLMIEKGNIRFHSRLSIGEDALFNLEYALYATSCCVTDLPIYSVSIENDQSLSRKTRSDLSEQLALGEMEMLRAIKKAEIAESDRQILLSAVNFLRLGEVYSEAKRLHIRRIDVLQRIRIIRSLCDAINRQNFPLPASRYCKLLSLPVKLRLAILIDLVGWKLAH